MKNIVNVSLSGKEKKACVDDAWYLIAENKVW